MRQLRHGLWMCAIQRVNGQDKIFKCLWTGHGSKCQSHRFVLRTAMLLGFSYSTVSRLYQGWSTIQRTSSQLDPTVGSVGVNMGQSSCGTLSTPSRVRAPTNWGQKGFPNVWYNQCLKFTQIEAGVSWLSDWIFLLTTTIIFGLPSGAAV